MKNGLKPDGDSDQPQNAFVRGMEEAVNQGLDFNLTVREALNDLLGNWAAQAFFSSTANSSKTPEVFVAGAKGCVLHADVRRYARHDRQTSLHSFPSCRSEESPNSSSWDMISQQVDGESNEKKLLPLHDLRAEDELDKLVGHKTT